MRHLSLVLFACVGAALLFTPRPATALGLSGSGGKLGILAPESGGSTPALAGHLEFESPGTRVHLMPSLMYWKDDAIGDLSANLDLYYHFDDEGYVTPYVGGGLGINFFSNSRTDRSDADVGLNVLGGVRFPGSFSHYFLEGRYTASDVSQLAVLGGITFHGGSVGR